MNEKIKAKLEVEIEANPAALACLITWLEIKDDRDKKPAGIMAHLIDQAVKAMITEVVEDGAKLQEDPQFKASVFPIED